MLDALVASFAMSVWAPPFKKEGRDGCASCMGRMIFSTSPSIFHLSGRLLARVPHGAALARLLGCLFHLSHVVRRMS